jgi:hypothetical protein
MEKFTNPWETRKLELSRLVSKYQQQALLDYVYEEAEREYKEVAEGSYRGPLLNNEVIKKYQEIKDRVLLQVETLPEFNYILSLLKKPGIDVSTIAAHENAHANVADVEGAEHGGYNVVFLKDLDGDPVYIFQARVGYPLELLMSENLDEVRKKIIQAPEKYGETLSESDKEDLERIKKKR